MSREALGEFEDGESAARYRRSRARTAKEMDGALASDADFGVASGRFGGRGGAARDLMRRKSVRGLYRKMPAVKEWAENNYYHVPIEQQLAGRVPINAFWRDYAAHLADGGDGPFLSEHVAVPTANFSEMMLALAVLDLPAKAGEHGVTTEDAALSLKAASPTIVFHKQIQEAPVSDDKTPVLVGQNFFRHGDRYVQVDGEQHDKYVTDEFLPDVVYGCQVVVTNPTSASQKLDILVQIPEKAMPVLGSKRTRSHPVTLGPYATQKLEYYFYFRASGDFAHYPVHVARDEALAAWAEPFTFHVVEQLSRIDTASWDYVSQWGTPLRWIRQGQRGFTANLTPLDPSGEIQSLLTARPCTWIFTSATLAVGNDFAHFTARLGISDIETRQIPSPFDFPKIARLYLPTGISGPNQPGYTEAAVEAMAAAVRLSQGRAFLLFTSHRALRRAAEILGADPSFEYPLLIQGTAPRSRLLEQFSRLGNAVLLGTATFWEGVDIRGPGLVLVAIDRLPFASPGDPMLAARLEAIRNQGGNPFRDYQLPQAVLSLKQGVGRLIRDYDDYGVIMICDPRLREKSYGRIFLRNIPAMPVTSELNEIQAFFSARQQADG